MSVVEQLIDLQDIDGRLRELEHELKDLPRRKALELARLSGVVADLAASKTNLQLLENRIKSIEAEAEALRNKIQQLKVTQASLDSNKEYAQYSMQIDLITHDLETTENTLLSTMDSLPSAKQRIEDAQSRHDTMRSGVDAVCAELDERLAAVKGEVDELMKSRAGKVAEIADPRARLYYERLKTKRWPVIVPLTHDGVCDGCHLVQPPSVSQLVDANSKLSGQGKPMNIVACTMCGRLLYRD
ncbi:MAG: hypothetical protein IJQ34_08905 [Kiritimatiellae bacterium]|nr:hypothetical protein [Kiritimatiellia bacterium]